MEIVSDDSEYDRYHIRDSIEYGSIDSDRLAMKSLPYHDFTLHCMYTLGAGYDYLLLHSNNFTPIYCDFAMGRLMAELFVMIKASIESGVVDNLSDLVMRIHNALNYKLQLIHDAITNGCSSTVNKVACKMPVNTKSARN